MPDDVVFEPAGALSASLSLFWVLATSACMVGPLAFSAWRWLVYRGRAMRAESIEHAPPRVTAGPALLRGRVETDDGGPAVRVEIDQVGQEWEHKNSWTHEWAEKNRVVHVRPFRLRTAEGEIVSVIPDEGVRVVDTLETDTVDGNYRRRVAEVTNGETVWVSGVLSQEGQKSGAKGAYRAGPASWVLRATRLEPMEIAAGALDRQFSYWATFYRKAVIIVGLILAASGGVFFSKYAALSAWGRTEVLEITKSSTYTTTSKGRTTTHYVLHARLPAKAGGGTIEDDVGFDLYFLAEKGDLKRAPFVYLPGAAWLHDIGKHPTLGIWRAALSAILAAAVLAFYVFVRKTSMPWYEQRTVVERANGRLSAQEWWAQEPGRPGLFVHRPPKPSPSISRSGA